MQLARNKLYALLLLVCLVGYSWVIYASHKSNVHANFHFCFIKSTLHIPCPSCGTTRSLMALAAGEFANALYWNPLGYLVGLLMMLFPLWIVRDFIFKSSSFYLYYTYLANQLHKRKFSIPIIIIMVINWYWNFKKGL